MFFLFCDKYLISWNLWYIYSHKLEQPGHKKSETALESGVRATRVQVMEVVNTLTAQKSLVEAYYNDIKEQTKCNSDIIIFKVE